MLLRITYKGLEICSYRVSTFSCSQQVHAERGSCTQTLKWQECCNASGTQGSRIQSPEHSRREELSDHRYMWKKNTTRKPLWWHLLGDTKFTALGGVTRQRVTSSEWSWQQQKHISEVFWGFSSRAAATQSLLPSADLSWSKGKQMGNYQGDVMPKVYFVITCLYSCFLRKVILSIPCHRCYLIRLVIQTEMIYVNFKSKLSWQSY